MNIADFKAHFYAGHDFIHFNNAGQSLIPDVNRDLAIKWLQRFYNEGSLCAMECWEQTEVVRQKLANFIGAQPQEIAFFQTTAAALSQAAFGIPLNSADEILIWDQEYPSNYYPWLKAAEIKRAQVIEVESEKWKTPAQKILDRVTKKTRVIAISWVQYQTGSVTDLKKIAEELKGSGIWLVADAVQGIGIRPFNFKDMGFDIICSGSHKWLCSAYGASYMAIKEERIEELRALSVGAMSYGTPDTGKNRDNLPRSDASRYEPGTKSMIEVVAMGESLDLLMKTGMENILNESCRLAERLGRGLESLGFKVISDGPIVNFAPHEILKSASSSIELIMEPIIQKLKSSKVSFARRGPGIRLSLHAYNRDSEVDRVLSLLEK